MLLALTLLACGAPDDTGADRLDLSTEVDSVLGDYHLALALAPDPPVVGPQVGVISLTRNVDSAALDGAVVAGAELVGTLTAPEEPGTDPWTVTFDEGSGGTYTADWTWSTDGYWELRIEIGDMVEDDSATLAVLVDPAE